MPLRLVERATTRVNWRKLTDAFDENTGKLEGLMSLRGIGPWNITMDVNKRKQHPARLVVVAARLDTEAL